MTTVNDDTAARNLRRLRRRRDLLLHQVEEAHELMTRTDITSSDLFLAKCDLLFAARKDFLEVQDEIFDANFDAPAESQIGIVEEGNRFEEMYFRVKSFEKALHRQSEELRQDRRSQGPVDDLANSTRLSDSANMSIRLPRLEVPIFAGDIKSYANFSAMYKSVIHDGPYPDAVKMSYLRSLLQGPALALIEHLPLTGDNYALAYNLIEQRFGSKRVRANFHINSPLNFKPLAGESLPELRGFLDVFGTEFKALENLELANLENYFMVCLALRNLPASLRTLFERQLESTTIPEFDTLIQFVEDQCRIKEFNSQFTINKGISKDQILNSGRKFPTPPAKKPYQHTLVMTPSPADQLPPDQDHRTTCPCCNNNHSIYGCKAFRHMSLQRRIRVVGEAQLCHRCLGRHASAQCTSTGQCSRCSLSDHHSLLHPHPNTTASASHHLPPVQPSGASGSTTADWEMPQTLVASEVAASPSTQSIVLLGTVQAFIKDKWGSWYPIRVVLDVGSQINLISAACVQRLGLTTQPRSIQICGAMQRSVGESSGVVKCTLSPRSFAFDPISVHANVVPQVCANLPTSSVNHDIYQRFQQLDLADRSFHRPGEIDFLLGASAYATLFKPGFQIIQGEPAAIQTTFGYVIIGSLSQACTPVDSNPPGNISLLTLDESVQRFWKEQEVCVELPNDPEDVLVEEHFTATHSRTSSGAYMVRLPFKTQTLPPFGNSRDIAARRWFTQERRLRQDTALKTHYNNFLQEYLDLGHMSLASSPGVNFIPHFAIVKDSPTTPVRVVFDGSCRDSSGLSINDRLHTGPALQQDIADIILLFRHQPVALTMDICKMFRQILIHPHDRKFQHIFFRKNENEPLLEYELNTVTYGLNPSPYQALRVLRQLITDDGAAFPRASRALRESTYIDDVCVAVSSITEACLLKTELITLLKLGGFELRKWASNEPAVLDDLPPDHKTAVLLLKADSEASLRVLGIKWHPSEDQFSYSVRELTPATTKRLVLSQIASIFDPMGWLAPMVFWAKTYLRALWTMTLDWDTPLPESMQAQWMTFANQFPELNQLTIPRYTGFPGAQVYHLVGFCDGSESGYAAAVYLRAASDDDSLVRTYLLKAKSRVAPLKTLTIPRLELNGALLLARLLHSLNPLIQAISVRDTYLYTDSTIVLQWLSFPPSKLKTYCANRVVEILTYTSVTQWRHVRTDLNAADCASRGLYPSNLISHPLWWSGPSFLLCPLAEWPALPDKYGSVSDLPEVKVDTVLSFTVTTADATSKEPFLISIINSFSTLNRLRRVLAWTMRFCHNVITGPPRRSGPLTVDEIQASMNAIVRSTQEHFFGPELSALQAGKLPKRLQGLLPFIDDVGLLRVGGRLQYSLLPFAAKHPLILPKNTHLTKLICDYYHQSLLHAGPQATQAAIQSRFWILSLRSYLRQQIRKCATCLRFSSTRQHPVMGVLPSIRVTPFRAFLHTGVDMAGPIFIKDSPRRNARITKAYLAVFVCTSTKAAHLEIVSDLTTVAFEAALSRFISRRGLCKKILCDNGKNFVGAANEAKRVVDFLRSSEANITNYLTTHEITYQFNPPEAPWMGGLWESAVKSAKRHLNRITANRKFTFEEMATLLCRIEATLNSRPLVRSSADPTEPLDVLTPGHFLIGGPLRLPPEDNVLSVPDNLLTRWKSIQQCHQEFWRRWSSEYLHTLTNRSKWIHSSAPLRVGDVVIILKENTRPLDWPLAIVQELRMGKDCIARSAV
ncbi:unnamed protein product, partial [Nesidiocoris tenuis]